MCICICSLMLVNRIDFWSNCSVFAVLMSTVILLLGRIGPNWWHSFLGLFLLTFLGLKKTSDPVLSMYIV